MTQHNDADLITMRLLLSCDSGNGDAFAMALREAVACPCTAVGTVANLCQMLVAALDWDWQSPMQAELARTLDMADR
jgi:hypothetical protein